MKCDTHVKSYIPTTNHSITPVLHFLTGIGKMIRLLLNCSHSILFMHIGGWNYPNANLAINHSQTASKCYTGVRNKPAVELFLQTKQPKTIIGTTRHSIICGQRSIKTKLSRKEVWDKLRSIFRNTNVKPRNEEKQHEPREHISFV